MDDLIQWEPQDNQHLTAKVEMMATPWGGSGVRIIPCCSLCGHAARGDDKYCGRCGARLERKEAE